MPVAVPRHLVVQLSDDALADALSDWKWLLPPDMRPLLVSTSGDVFFIDAAGQVHWLETGAGKLQQIAGSGGEFESAVRHAESRAEWFFEPVIDGLRAKGIHIAPGECYGYRTLPVLGGNYDDDNRVAVDAAGHIRFTGYVHGQIKDLPEGTEVVLKWTDDARTEQRVAGKKSWWRRLINRR